MKTFKSKYMFVSAIIVASMIGGGAVYALTSIDFATRAQSWVKAKCTDKLAASSNTTTNNEYATTCYNYSQNQKQDADIASMKSVMGPMLYDGNNNFLGSLIQSGGPQDVQYYDSKLKLIIPVNGQSGNINFAGAAHYTTTDCTGTAYDFNNNTDGLHLLKFYSRQDEGLINNIGYFKIAVEDINKPVWVAAKSFMQPDGCHSTNSGTYAQKLTAVNFETKLPLMLPLQLK